MDKLGEYKNFLPQKIYIKRKQKNAEREKTALLIILCINIIFSFEVIGKITKKNESGKETFFSNDVDDKKILLSKQLDLFENIIVEGEIINGIGEIKTKEENVKMIEKNIKLNSIELQEKYAYLKFEGD